jgi:hypothetical protein
LSFFLYKIGLEPISQPWLKVPPSSVFDKRSRIKITLYGQYGIFEARLNELAARLRHEHYFSDTYLVGERDDFRKQNFDETIEEYNTRKSYYYLKVSNVNLFIFYCGEYGASAAMELKHICDRLKFKIPCCCVLKDTGCKMPTILLGQARMAKIFVEEFDGYNKRCDDIVLEILAARCTEFLVTKFHQLP